MKIVSKTDLKKMSFIDFEVLDTCLEKNSKFICFFISGAYHKPDAKLIELGKGYLKILGYDSMQITSYNGVENSEKILSEDDFENLSELCEIDIDERKLVIKGFAKHTRNWIEFSVIGGQVEGDFSEC